MPVIRPRVLVADDVPGTRDLIVQMLEVQGLPVVAQAEDGREAVQLARAQHIDVAVMDLVMPNLGGIEATRIIREFRPETQVVIFTMFEDEADRAAALQAGAFAYLVKGAAFPDLASVIRQAYTRLAKDDHIADSSPRVAEG